MNAHDMAQNQSPAPGKDNDVKKTNLLSKSKDFLQGAFDSISGKELPRLVEDFTRDMVIIAEGLFQDQEALRNTLNIQAQEQDQLAQSLREMGKRINELSKKVDTLNQRSQKRLKGETGLARILRQATWLAFVIGGSWIIVTLIQALVK